MTATDPMLMHGRVIRLPNLRVEFVLRPFLSFQHHHVKFEFQLCPTIILSRSKVLDEIIYDRKSHIISEVRIVSRIDLGHEWGDGLVRDLRK